MKDDVSFTIDRLGRQKTASSSVSTHTFAYNSVLLLASETIVADSTTNVTTIWEQAFADCSSLTNVAISDSVTNVGRYAFNKCIELTSITIPKSVTSIEFRAFAGCTKLTGVYFLGNAPSVDWDVFFDHATIYYLAGTKGWGKEFGGRPTALWTAPPPP